MLSKPAGEVLYDLEAALRLVDSALREFGAGMTEPVSLGSRGSTGATQAPHLLTEPGHQALLAVLNTLRRSRSVLQHPAVETPALAGDQPPDRPAFGEVETADTTSDQLDFASAVLEDVEHRVAAIVAALGSAA